MKNITLLKILINSILVLLVVQANAADEFVKDTITLTGVRDGDVQWGDYDNDGDLDLLVVGSDGTVNTANIYRNDGSGVFTNINAGLTGVKYASADWGDFDGDGDLDLVIIGTSQTSYSDAITQIYQNEGSDSFVPFNTELQDVYYGSVSWADFDNDGDQDLLLTGKYGYNLSNCITKLYKNTLPDSIGFIDIDAELHNVCYSDVSWGDYDNDGDQDILISGNSGSGNVSKIYRNDFNSSGMFNEIEANLVGFRYSTLAWGDSDNDGDLDILISGISSQDTCTLLYRNDLNEVFTAMDPGIEQFDYGKLSWGDYDNDGDLDIALCGNIGSGSYIEASKIYKNEGNNSFTNILASIDSVYFSSNAWGDYDNDGDLDLVIAGRNSDGQFTRLIKNESSIANTLPSQPSAFTANFINNKTELSWNAANDTETASSGLNYNLFIKKKSSSNYILSPLADTNTGFRTIVKNGITKNNTLSYSNISRGTYRCGVQAIDAGFTGSDFAITEFTIANNTPTKPQILYPENRHVFYADSICLKWSAMDYDNDALSYTIMLGTDDLTTYAQNITADSIWIKNLIPYKEYQWQVIAIDVMNDSAISNIQYFTTTLIEDEPNNEKTLASVSNDTLGFYGKVGGTSDEVDYLSFNYPYNGYFNITITNLNSDTVTNGGLYTAYIYDKDENQILNISSSYLDQGEAYTTSNITLYANQDYFIKVSPENETKMVPYKVTFSVDTNLLADNYELNNTKETAYPLFTDSIYATVGCINDANDWYKVKFNDVGTFQVEITNPDTFPDLIGGLGTVYIYNEDETKVSSIYSNSIYNGGSATSTSVGITGNQEFYINIRPISQYAGADYILKIISALQVTNSVQSPTVPMPLNIANNNNSIIPGDTVVQWFCSHPDSLPITYNFYCGKTSPPPLVAKGLTSNEYSIENIELNDSIFWKVSALTAGADSVTSPVYNFSSKRFSTTSISFKNLTEGASDWGDFDNDGDLDLLLIGLTSSYTTGAASIVYKNNGSETEGFSEIYTELPPVYYGDAVWGDYDNDNDLDILITGTTSGNASGALTAVYRNNGDNTFSDINANLPGVYKSHSEWGDFNNDGLLDIAITGTLDGSATGAISMIYKNNGDGSFTNINAGLKGTFYSEILWVDYNNDGYLDVFITGSKDETSERMFTSLYKNNKNGTFTDIGADLPQLYASSADWGDFDNDGDMDLVLTGSQATSSWTSKVTKVYRNNYPDTVAFTNIASLKGISSSSVDWGDYNNDGFLDIILTGYDGDDRLSRIYRNNQNNTFTNTKSDIKAYSNGSVSWVDFDNDSDLDFHYSSGYVNILYKNNTQVKNSLPGAPTGLYSVFTGNSMIFGWDAAIDNETSSLGLSYNLVLVDANKKMVWSTISDTASGKLKKAEPGLIKNNGLTISTDKLAAGSYQWKVQAVDASHCGGAWSTYSKVNVPNEMPISISPVSPSNDSLNVNINNVILEWTAAHTSGKILTYTIYFGTDSKKPEKVATQSELTYLLKELEYATSYFWRIEAADEDGNTVSTEIQQFVTLINNAPEVSLVSPTNYSTFSTRSAIFTWRASDAEEDSLHYTLWLHTSGRDTMYFENLTDTLFQIDTLSYKLYYYWQVTAFDSYGNATQSDTRRVKIGSNQAPTIELLAPSYYSRLFPSVINLIWTASDIDNDTMKFKIEITCADDDTLIIENYSDTVYALLTDTLVYGAQYYWQVTAIDSYGNKTVSSKWSIRASNGSPVIELIAPQNDSINAPRYVDLIWRGTDPENDSLTYDLYFGRSSYNLDIYAENISDTFLAIGPLTCSRNYYWQVVAKDTFGNEKESSKYEFRIFENSVPAVTLISPQNYMKDMPNTVTLTWSAFDPDNDSISYTFYYYDKGYNDTVYFHNLVDTSINITGLNVGTRYYWQVIATDIYGNLGYSELWNFSTAETPSGWFKFHVSNVLDEPIRDVEIYIEGDRGYVSDNTGYAESGVLPVGNYNITFTKKSYNIYTLYNYKINEFDTTHVEINLSSLGDFNADNRMDITDIDSLVANWRNENSRFDIGPAFGVAPNLEVYPDGVFNFDDVMIFSIMWGYNNSDENLKALTAPTIIDDDDNTIQVLNRAQFNLSNELNYLLSFNGLGSINSSQIQVKYNPVDWEFAGVKNITPNSNNIFFKQHNEQEGLIKVSSAYIESLNIEDETQFMKLSFNKTSESTTMPEVIYEVHKANNTISAGFIENNNIEPMIEVFPNPAFNELNIGVMGIEAPDQILITNSVGKKLFWSDEVEPYTRIDISDFESSLLIVKVLVKEQVITRKIVKSTK